MSENINSSKFKIELQLDAEKARGELSAFASSTESTIGKIDALQAHIDSLRGNKKYQGEPDLFSNFVGDSTATTSISGALAQMSDVFKTLNARLASLNGAGADNFARLLFDQYATSFKDLQSYARQMTALSKTPGLNVSRQESISGLNTRSMLNAMSLSRILEYTKDAASMGLTDASLGKTLVDLRPLVSILISGYTKNYGIQDINYLTSLVTQDKTFSSAISKMKTSSGSEFTKAQIENVAKAAIAYSASHQFKDANNLRFLGHTAPTTIKQMTVTDQVPRIQICNS